MKFLNLKLMTIAAGAIGAMVLAPLASATVVGELQTSAEAGGGGVTVSDSAITFLTGTNGNCPTSGTCDFSVSSGTTMTYGPGSTTPVATSDNGTFESLVFNTPPSQPFMVLYNSAGTAQIDFDLTTLSSPSPTNGTNCAGVTTPGSSCIAFAGSPFLLTLAPNGSSTSVTLSLSGEAIDLENSDATSGYTGSLAETVNETPAQIQAAFCGAQTNYSTPCSTTTTITTGHTGEFIASVVPEPTTAFLGLSGLLMAAGLYRRRRNRKV